jgi:hypothetical protein
MPPKANGDALVGLMRRLWAANIFTCGTYKLTEMMGSGGTTTFHCMVRLDSPSEGAHPEKVA